MILSCSFIWNLFLCLLILSTFLCLFLFVSEVSYVFCSWQPWLYEDEVLHCLAVQHSPFTRTWHFRGISYVCCLHPAMVCKSFFLSVQTIALTLCLFCAVSVMFVRSRQASSVGPWQHKGLVWGWAHSGRKFALSLGQILHSWMTTRGTVHGGAGGSLRCVMSLLLAIGQGSDMALLEFALSH